MITKEQFLILNVAVAFYNVGTIWAHEVDIFRSWKYIDTKIFPIAQRTHWKKLPYWVFAPVGLAFIGSILLIGYHPDIVPSWEIWVALLAQLLSHVLTAIFWGQWQAKLSKDNRGSASPYLDNILKTHWVRTALINIYGFTLLAVAIQTLR